MGLIQAEAEFLAELDAMQRPQKITFGEMGVEGRREDPCALRLPGRAIEMDASRWPDDMPMSSRNSRVRFAATVARRSGQAMGQQEWALDEIRFPLAPSPTLRRPQCRLSGTRARPSNRSRRAEYISSKSTTPSCSATKRTPAEYHRRPRIARFPAWMVGNCTKAERS